MRDLTGTTVLHYRILERVGEGGMGVVYRAEDTRLKRSVALKFLPADLTRDPEAKARFTQEAQAASSLQHPNICTIHDINETEEGQLFICMDLYEGETLRERIERGPLPVEEGMGIAVQIAQGLARAHEKGIVHRDIKPANIFVSNDG
ncbi:MAG: serine/threonine-protein kinase, partial [Bacteroidota bacterium]